MTMTEMLNATNSLSRAELIVRLQATEADHANAAALATKLQTLLDSKTHECEALRRALDARTCDGEPDLNTVPLRDLLAEVSTYVDDGQSVTVHARARYSVNALGREFICDAAEANSLLEASARLLRAEAA